MDYKEEYLNALERARKGLPLDEVFPELKESEDERIRKELLEQVQYIVPEEGEADDEGKILPAYYKRIDRYRAWLEKHKEQERIVPEREATDFEIEVHEIIAQARSDKRLADKDVLEQFEREAACALMWKVEKQKEPKDVSASTMAPGCWQGEEKSAEWSEEDEECRKELIQYIEQRIGDGTTGQSLWKKWHNWLKCLPERFNLLPKQEWSEEDEAYLQTVISEMEASKKEAREYEHKTYDTIILWLKSLRPQPHWKPSDEQMKALLSKLPVIKGSGDKVQDILESLYNDLKKL